MGFLKRIKMEVFKMTKKKPNNPSPIVTFGLGAGLGYIVGRKFNQKKRRRC